MRLLGISVLLSGWCAILLHAGPPSVHAIEKLPLSFERQDDRFVAHGQRYSIGIQDAKASVAAAGSTVSLEFAGSRHTAAVPGPELPGKVNYILGNDPSKWKLGLPTYERVRYDEVYPGIDLIYYGNQQQLEFDLVLKPGADPRSIRMKLAGARNVSLDPKGELVMKIASGEVRLALPQIYQEGKAVAGHYKLRRNEVTFELAKYDHKKPLVIDPTIVYSTLLGGGTGNTQGNAIALDSAGNMYVTGYTSASDFPVVSAPHPGLAADGQDGFVSKINAAGTALIYSTYLGGNGYDYLQGIAVDSSGAAWVVGSTGSTDFPTVNPHQGTNGGSNDVVVAKLSSTGLLQYSTYLGGNGTDYGYGIAVDSSGNAYVAGETSGPFPTTLGVLQSTSQGTDAFVAKFAPSGSLLYSTLLGGASYDTAHAIAADSGGNVYVTGNTSSTSFTGAPAGGARTTNAGNGDVFVAKLNATGTVLLYFTFLGGSEPESGDAITIDNGGNAYIGGYTYSTDLGTTPGVVQGSLSGGTDGFVAKLNSAGSSFSYVTYLGGQRDDFVDALASDASSGGVYVAGSTTSSTFPQVSSVQGSFGNATSLFQTINSGASWSGFEMNIPGTVFSISADPITSGTLLATTDQGILRTTNNGASWTQVLSAGGQLSRGPASPNTVYAAANNAYQSTDGGVTWTLKGFINGAFLVADPLTSSTAYAFNASGVLKTTDSGQTWSPANSGLPSMYVTDLIAASDGSLYAALYQYGIYKSTNQGASWIPMNSGLPSLYNSSRVLTASASNPAVVYLAYGTIYKTSNGGATWVPTTASVPAGASSASASPLNSDLVYATSATSPYLYLSMDGGSVWNPVTSGLGTAKPQGIFFDPTSSNRAFATAAVTTNGFVAKLNSTGTALTYSTYLGASADTNAFGIATNSAGDAFVAGTESGADFPVTPIALPSNNTGSNAFVTRISDATAPCSYSVSPLTRLVSGSTNALTYDVIAPSGCAWTGSSNQAWAIVAGASGTGAGRFSVTTQPNSSGSTRSATVTVGGQIATLGQVSNTCSYSLSPSNVSLSSLGGPVNVTVTTETGCDWTVTNNYPYAITVLTGSGTGIGTLSLSVASNFGSNPRSFFLQGINFSLSITQAAPAPVAGPPAIRDFNADGKSDVFLYDPVAGGGYTGLSNGTGGFTYVATPATPGFTAIRYGELNGDGKSDLVVYNSVSTLGYVLVGNGSGGFTPVSLFWGPGFTRVAAGDLNADGRTDFLIYRPTDGTSYTAISNGDGTFTYQYTLASIGFTHVTVADFNADGKADVFYYRSSDGLAYLGISNGTGGFSFSPVTVGGGYDFVESGDLNGDGKFDLAFYSSVSGAFKVGLSTGSGFTFTTNSYSPGFTTVKLFDFNGDGKSDVALYNKTSTLGYLGVGDGTGNFTFGSLFWGAGMDTVDAPDLNGDGKEDIVIYNSTNGASYTGISSGNAASPFSYQYAYWGNGKLTATAAAQP